MKKVIWVVAVCLLILSLMSGCGEKPLTVQTDNIAKIALSSASGGSIILDKTEDITSILLALDNSSCFTTTTKNEALPQEQYRFTCYDNNDIGIHTYVLFSDAYLQADSALYKGDLSDLQVLFDGFCKTSSLTDLSPAFAAKSAEITEIAFYNITDKTFKMVTTEKDIQSVLSPLQSLKLSDKEVNGKVSQQMVLYFRLNNANEYLPAVEITRYETGTICQVGGKSAQVSNFNWDVLYTKLNYNKMPIK